MRTIVSNIKTLVGVDPERKLRLQGTEMARLDAIDDAWLLIDDERISGFGSMAELPAEGVSADVEIDARGGVVMPSWCDPHYFTKFCS